MKLPNIARDKPWRSDEKDHAKPYQNIKIKSGHHTICEIYIDDAPVRDYNEMQEAHAKAIIALPQLLLVLEKAVRVLTRDYIDPQKMSVIKECEEVLISAGCRDV